MFSATFPTEVQQLAGKFLHNYLFLAVGVVGGACADVEQTLHQVTRFEKRNQLIDLLNKVNTEKTIVFVETKRNADFLAAYLSQNGYPTTSIHGDRLQREREEALRDFRGNNMRILMATAVAARGLGECLLYCSYVKHLT
jgi:superfamily II DNA/RNA helicase